MDCHMQTHALWAETHMHTHALQTQAVEGPDETGLQSTLQLVYQPWQLVGRSPPWALSQQLQSLHMRMHNSVSA